MAEVKIKFSADIEAAKKQLADLQRTGEETKKRLAEGGSDRRTDLEALRTAKQQLAAAEAEKKEIQAKIQAQAEAVKQAQAAAAATAEGTREHTAATAELKKQQDILTNLKTLGRTKDQTVSAALSNVGTIRNGIRAAAPTVAPAVDPAPALRGFARIRAAASQTAARIRAGFATASQKIGSFFTGMKALAGAALAYAGINSIKQEITELDNLAKHARTLDIDTTSFQKLKYAADSNNVAFSTVETGITRMKKTIGDAANGSADAAAKLARIGYTAKDLQGLTTAQQFDEIARAVASIQDPAERSAVAMELFGKSGAQLEDFLRNYKQQGEELEARGGIIKDSELKAAEDFNQALLDISRTIKSLAFNSGFISQLKEMVQLLDFWTSNQQQRTEQQAAARGVYNRKTGTDFAVQKLLESGNFTPEQAQRLKAAAGIYRLGEEAPAGFYTSEYKMIDAELRRRGLGSLARQPVKHWFGTNMEFGEDTTASATMTEEEKKAAAEKAKAEREKRRQQREADEARRRKLQEAQLQAKLDEQVKNLSGSAGSPKEQTREEYVASEVAKAEKTASGMHSALTPQMRANIEQAAGAKYDRDQAKKQQEAADAVNEEIRGMEEKLRLQQMILAGKGREAAVEEAIARARKQAESRGTTLSADQEARIRTVTEAAFDLDARKGMKSPARTPDTYASYGLRAMGGMIAGASRAGTFSTDYSRSSYEKLTGLETTLTNLNNKIPGRTEVQNVRVKL